MFRIPTVEDMLIAYATIPGYVANRDNMRGTWFIESICKVFMNHAAGMDIKEMMDEVITYFINWLILIVLSHYMIPENKRTTFFL